MTLDQWFQRQHRGAVSMMATVLKVEPSTIWRWRRRQTTPGTQHIQAIERYTQGAVTPRDWFPSQQSAE